MLKTLFWILFFIILYTYVGYALILLLLNVIKQLFKIRKASEPSQEYPLVCLLIAAYNEKDMVARKMENTLALHYPSAKLQVVWITDGSDDGTPEELKKYPGVTVLHQEERQGKTAALNRAMEHIKTEYVVFCDANTMLDSEAIKYLVGPFTDPKTGCVAGEKRIAKNVSDFATGAGEGAYWQYESLIKRLESNLYSAIAAAGELYALRSSLFLRAEPDSIIDDFVISLNIARQGYRITYEPRAFAMETASASIQDELKRKIRIASGGFQTLFRYPSLMNLFRYGFFSFEYISHKVIRWLLVPFSIPMLFLFNLLICIGSGWVQDLYLVCMAVQAAFYFLVVLGAAFSKKITRFKFLFLPYYLIIMNYAQIAGLIRYLRRKHSVVWEKVRRA